MLAWHHHIYKDSGGDSEDAVRAETFLQSWHDRRRRNGEMGKRARQAYAESSRLKMRVAGLSRTPQNPSSVDDGLRMDLPSPVRNKQERPDESKTKAAKCSRQNSEWVWRDFPTKVASRTRKWKRKEKRVWQTSDQAYDGLTEENTSALRAPAGDEPELAGIRLQPCFRKPAMPIVVTSRKPSWLLLAYFLTIVSGQQPFPA